MSIHDGWRFCPRCATGLEPQRDRLHCPGCGSDYWANSMPATQGFLERDGRVLLGRRKHDPRAGHWDIPGGFLDEGEEPLVGLRRELLEETGIEVEPVEWLGAFVDPYGERFVLGLGWIVAGDGEPRAADDIDELTWFGPDELPEEMAFPTQVEALRLWAARVRGR